MDGFPPKITFADISMAAILVSGFVILCIWFFRSAFSRKALAGSQPRRNNMHPAVPLLLIFAYFLLSVLVASIIQSIWRLKEESWQFLLSSNIAMSFSGIIIFILGIMLAKQNFARSIKGLGLNPRTILRDIGGAILNYWAILPALYAMVYLTGLFGTYFIGPQFKLSQHPELQNLEEFSSSLPLIISIFILAVVIAPFVEELIFRGLLQTTIRSYGFGPWLAIAISSVFFVISHPSNPSHWPALFALSMGIGYSYEKSGSLFRPILFHVFFNASSVIGTLVLAHSAA